MATWRTYSVSSPVADPILDFRENDRTALADGDVVLEFSKMKPSDWGIMASCSNCGQKIGLFKRLCSDCQTAADAAAALQRREAEERRLEQERVDAERTEMKRQEAERAAAEAERQRQAQALLDAEEARRKRQEAEAEAIKQRDERREQERINAEQRLLAKISVEFDEFTQRYLIKHPRARISFATSGGFRLSGRTEVLTGSEFNKDGSSCITWVMFIRVGEGWEWLKNNQIIALVDGQPEQLRQSPGVHDVIGGGQVTEVETVYLEPHDLEAWFAASSIRVRVGSWDATIERSIVEQLRTIELKRAALIAS